MNSTEAMVVYDTKKKRYWVAYFLLMFFGFVVWWHRFYAGSKNDKRIAMAMILVLLFAFVVHAWDMMSVARGLVILHHIVFLIDIFYTGFMVKRFNSELLKSLNP